MVQTDKCEDPNTQWWQKGEGGGSKRKEEGRRSGNSTTAAAAGAGDAMRMPETTAKRNDFGRIESDRIDINKLRKPRWLLGL